MINSHYALFALRIEYKANYTPQYKFKIFQMKCFSLIIKRTFVVCFLFVSCSCFSQVNTKVIYKDPAQPIENRVGDLLSRMTLEEKFAQIDIWKPNPKELLKTMSVESVVKQISGSLVNGFGFIQYNSSLPVEEFASFHNAVQKYLMEQTRLGIPIISNGETLHGFMGNNGTVYPVPVSMASTWDTALVEKIFSACALEMRYYGQTHAASPVFDLMREPRFGRVDEMFSEDPYLTASMGVASVFGLQGRSCKIDGSHVIACAKHFTGHGQPEGGANIGPGNISERVLRETQFYPFEMAVKKANIRTVMASYNEIDGVPSHGNSWLLNNVLRGEWGFTGYVISDYDGVNRMFSKQKVCRNQAEAGKRAIESGMDFECPHNDADDCFKYIPEMVKSDNIKMSVLDSAVARVLRNKFILGLFDQPYIVTTKQASSVINCLAHKQLALEAAEKGIILLKNENNTLPYSDLKVKKLALIGPNADEVHYGSYSNNSTKGVSILEGLKKYGQGKFEVVYSEGFNIYENDTTLKAEFKTLEAENNRIKEAVNTASQSDAILLVLGENELTCRESWFLKFPFEHTGDRDNLDLLGRQDDLLKALLETGKPLTVLLINGRTLSFNYIAEKAPAIIEGWYLGQEQGTAVANVLFGKVNPSGKLTVTIPKSVGQLPVYYNQKPNMHEIGYISGKFAPLYPFGFGLSYTNYKYDSLKIENEKVIVGQVVNVSIRVTNMGDRDGDEIVQLYLRDEYSTVTRPVKELKDFQRVSLKKGESKIVRFAIPAEKLQFYNLQMKRVVEPGRFEVMIGGSSTDYLSGFFEVL
jgi:beta-glucosidase